MNKEHGVQDYRIQGYRIQGLGYRVASSYPNHYCMPCSSSVGDA
jgi:hypothetical protein